MTNSTPKVTSWRKAGLAGLVVLVLAGGFLAGWLRERRPKSTGVSAPSRSPDPAVRTGGVGTAMERVRSGLGTADRTTEAAAAVVSRQVARYARSRLELARALAQRHGVMLTEDIEAFFAALEGGRWEDVESHYQRLHGVSRVPGEGPERSPEVQAVWPAILDAFGAAEQAHRWPPAELLAYGESILSALRPGMVYVGGTDTGRWIPALLNEGESGGAHLMLTQNALADASYMDYLRLQFGDRLPLPAEGEAAQAFSDYVADAQRRLEHDRQFPNEPPQLRPGEEVRITEGRVQVSGQVAVMSINERLLAAVIAANPDRTFAVEESYPLRTTYADALPLGPLMELKARTEQNPFSADQAAAAAAYWQEAARGWEGEAGKETSEVARKTYSHNMTSTANLLSAHQFGTEAEATYRLAARVWPGNPEPVMGLAGMLELRGRSAEAAALMEEFFQRNPDRRPSAATGP